MKRKRAASASERPITVLAGQAIHRAVKSTTREQRASDFFDSWAEQRQAKPIPHDEQMEILRDAFPNKDLDFEELLGPRPRAKKPKKVSKVAK